MQPPDRNFPTPDPGAFITPNSQPTPPPSPSVFEEAPSPTNSATPPSIATGAQTPPPSLVPIVSGPSAPPAPIPQPYETATAPVPDPPSFSHRIARWRWAMSLLLIGFYPVFVSLLGKLRPSHAVKGAAPALPSSVGGLVLFSGLELGVFGLFWLLGWAFSRATKDDLLLRWRGGIMPVLQGFGYAIALRLALVFIILFVAVLVLTATGLDPKQFAKFIKDNQPQTDSLFSKSALANPLYLLAMTTILSFVVAGCREELWRTAALASLRNLFPDHWSERARWIWAIGLSSIVFGLGHLYQGGLGVVFTSILGAGLGAVTWRHRSIWPSVFAHGFIDATSFLAAAAMAGKKIPMPAFWWHW